MSINVFRTALQQQIPPLVAKLVRQLNASPGIRKSLIKQATVQTNSKKGSVVRQPPIPLTHPAEVSFLEKLEGMSLRSPTSGKPPREITKRLTKTMVSNLIAPAIEKIHADTVSVYAQQQSPPPLPLNTRFGITTLQAEVIGALAKHNLDEKSQTTIIDAILAEHNRQAPKSVLQLATLKGESRRAAFEEKIPSARLKAETNRIDYENSKAKRDLGLGALVETVQDRWRVKAEAARAQLLNEDGMPVAPPKEKKRVGPPVLPPEVYGPDSTLPDDVIDAGDSDELPMELQWYDIQSPEVRKYEKDKRSAELRKPYDQRTADARSKAQLAKQDREIAKRRSRREAINTLEEKRFARGVESKLEVDAGQISHASEIRRRDDRMARDSFELNPNRVNRSDILNAALDQVPTQGDRLKNLFGQLIAETRRTNDVLTSKQRNSDYNQLGLITKKRSEDQAANLFGRPFDNQGNPIPPYKQGAAQITSFVRERGQERSQTRALDAMQNAYERGNAYNNSKKLESRGRDGAVRVREAVRNEIDTQSRRDKLLRDGSQAQDWAQGRVYDDYKLNEAVDRSNIADKRNREMNLNEFGWDVGARLKSRELQTAKEQAARNADEQLNNVVDFLFKPAAQRKAPRVYNDDEFQPGRGLAANTGTFFEPTDTLSWNKAPVLVKSGTYLKGLLYKSLYQHQDNDFARNFKQLDVDQKERYLNGLVQGIYESTQVLAPLANNQRREDWFTDLLKAAGEQNPQLKVLQGGKNKKKKSQIESIQVSPEDAAFNTFLRKASSVLKISSTNTSISPQGMRTDNFNIRASPEQLNALRNVHTAVNLLMHQTRLPNDALQEHRRDAAHQLTLFMGVTNRLVRPPEEREQRVA